MNPWQRMVTAFHEKMGIPVGDRTQPFVSREDLRVELIREEFQELKDALADGDDLEGVIDALVDILYVVIGAAVEWGIDLDPFFVEVNSANMRKAGGPIRDDGKHLKPKGWKPPDIARVLRRSIRRERLSGSTKGWPDDNA